MVDVVTDVASRIGIPLTNIDAVGLAFGEQYSQAIVNLFGTEVFTNNEAYLGIAKTLTEFEQKQPKHTILFSGYVFELILQGLSISNNVHDWPPELQNGIYIVSHELGHCKDAEARFRSSTEQSLRFPKGFDLDLVHSYYFPIFIDEFFASFHGDKFYSREHFAYNLTQDHDAITRIKERVNNYKNNYFADDRIFQIAINASALVWTYLIQYGKLWVGKYRTSFAQEPVPEILKYGFLEPSVILLLDQIFDVLIKTYPNLPENLEAEFKPIWNQISLHVGYKFEKRTEGWYCFWNQTTGFGTA